MVSKKVLLPEGVQDLLIDDCIYRRKIENKLMETFNQLGYMEVSTPTLEYYNLFSYDYLLKNSDKMFKLIDTKGSLLVLRPDCTIPIARMVATKMKDFVYPLKLCYIQNVFRIDEEQAGKKREYRQAGVELFGIDSYQADVEVIITAIESLKELGLEDFQIEIGQIKLIKELISKLNLSEEDEEKLFYYIENKNFIDLDKMVTSINIDEDDLEVLIKIPKLFGSPNMVFETLQQMPIKDNLKAAVEDLQNVCKMVEQYGYGEYISVDLGLVSRMGYYTGIIFKGYTKDLGEVLCSGGRYDKLLEDFGVTCSATGFAFVVNKITKALKIQEKLEQIKQKHILIVDNLQQQEETIKLLKTFRKKGYIVEISLLDKEEEIMEYSQKRRVNEIWRLNRVGEPTVTILEEWKDGNC